MFCYPKGSLIIVAGFILLHSCTVTKPTAPVENKVVTPPVAATVADPATKPLLEGLLAQYPDYFDKILQQRKALNVQVIYTQIDRKADGTVQLKDHYFNVDGSRYFYPASAIKLPVVLLALQKLNEWKAKGIDKNTAMISETAFSGQTPVYNDPTTADGQPSIASYIKKILMVSDNDAYNRLYEFLGQEYINTQLHNKGYSDVQVLHRLDIFLTDEENRRTNPVKFLDSNTHVLYSQPALHNTARYAPRNDTIGKGYYKSGKLVRSPMNFSGKNRISLSDMHHILISLVFPEQVSVNQRFNITDTDKQFIMKYMSQYPTESKYPPYADDTLQYWPAYGKFLLFGQERGKMPPNIRIFNKEGDAYGHLVDVAYVADPKNNIEFFLSAVIYCNSDGILNDDRYDYTTIGLPFMKHLGQVIYDHELKRERKIRPDLSPFIFKYDK